MSLNKVIIIGNLGKDPEVSTTGGGVSVAKLSVATTERYKDRNGDIKEVTEWHVARVWRQNADYIGKYGKKGAQVYVEGRLHNDSWDGRDGQKHTQTLIEVDEIQLLGRKNDDREERGSGNGDTRRSRQQYEPQPGELDPQDSDLPF